MKFIKYPLVICAAVVCYLFYYLSFKEGRLNQNMYKFLCSVGITDNPLMFENYNKDIFFVSEDTGQFLKFEFILDGSSFDKSLDIVKIESEKVEAKLVRHYENVNFTSITAIVKNVELTLVLKDVNGVYKCELWQPK